MSGFLSRFPDATLPLGDRQWLPFQHGSTLKISHALLKSELGEIAGLSEDYLVLFLLLYRMFVEVKLGESQLH